MDRRILNVYASIPIQNIMPGLKSADYNVLHAKKVLILLGPANVVINTKSMKPNL
jgi:hypothetical protein